MRDRGSVSFCAATVTGFSGPAIPVTPPLGGGAVRVAPNFLG